MNVPINVVIFAADDSVTALNKKNGLGRFVKEVWVYDFLQVCHQP